MTLTTVVVLVTALGVPGAPRQKTPPPTPTASPKPQPRSGPRQTVLVMPVMARNGASQGTGTALGQLIQSTMTELEGYDVSGYEALSYGIKDPVVPGLARCPDLSCAVELGRRLQFDQVIVGTLDGTNGDPRLVMWRVAVQDGSVLGIYENTLDEASLDALSRRPEAVVAALMRPGALQRPVEAAVTPVKPAEPVAPTPPSAPVTPRPPVAPAPACPPSGVDAAVVESPVKGGLRFMAAAALGAAGMGLLAAAGVGVGYAGLLLYDVTSVRRTGRHPFTRTFSLGVDLTAFSLGGLGLVALPVAILGVGTLAWTYLMPTP